jgi:tRNA (cytidine56-2'-O)-methyltransferase
LTTHVALTARALGASGIFLTDVEDEKIRKTVSEVVENWGGSFFFQMGAPWKQIVKNWRTNGGLVVHLTAYGENIQTNSTIEYIRNTGKNVLAIVGSRKVPSQFFAQEVADFNIAIGNQPHSECSSLAVFLDRYFKGKELERKFEGAKLQIYPQKHGKKVVSKDNI